MGFETFEDEEIDNQRVHDEVMSAWNLIVKSENDMEK